MTRIAHISDIHFGRIAYANDAQIDIVQALIDDINAASVDLVVVSGDLTQRAFGHQFRAARRML
ncbi:MAG: metallophosphoesterase, partial [Rhodothermales bacterium]|nr:metallophosphoesterase [Rhodothermales bacterium]